MLGSNPSGKQVFLSLGHHPKTVLNPRDRPINVILENKTSKYALPKAWFRFFFWDIARVVLPRVCLSGFLLAQPLLLTRLVDTVGGGTISRYVIAGLCGATVLIYFGLAVSCLALQSWKIVLTLLGYQALQRDSSTT